MSRWAWTLASAAIGLTVLAAPVGAKEEGRFSLTPYLWLPNIEGDLRFDRPAGAEGSPDIEIGPVDWLERLELGVTLAGEARFGRFSALTDIVYVDFGDQSGSVTSVSGPGSIEIPLEAGAETDFSGWLWSLAGGLTLIDGDRATLQALAGVRYLGAEASVDWRLSGPFDLLPPTGSASRDIDAWDGLVGVRGEVRAWEHWIFPYYVDVGAGESELTWQGIVGVGYRFGWGDLRVNYRHLHYEQDDHEAIERIDLSGPALSATLRF